MIPRSANWTCAPPIIITCLGRIPFHDRHAEDSSGQVCLRTDNPIRPGIGEREG